MLVASVVALLVGILLMSQAAQAQGLLDAPQGAVQETVGAPAAPAQEQQTAPVQEAAPVRQPEPATLDSTQQTTAPISAPASEPVASEPAQDQGPAPIQQQAAPAQEQAIEPVTGAAGQTTGTAPGTVQGTVAPAAEPVAEPVGQTTGAVAQTAEPVTAPVKQTAAPVVGTVEQSAEPVVDTVDETPHLAQETVGPATQPVLETANETTEAGDPVVQPVADTVEGTTEPVKDTVEPVVGTVEESAEPVLDTVEPIVRPVKDTVEPVVDPVEDPDTPPAPPADDPGVPGAKPVQETVDPVDAGGPGLKPNERPDAGVATTHRPDELPNLRGPQPTEAESIEALADPAGQAAEPVVGSTPDPVLRTEGSAGEAAVFEEGALRAGEGISLGASSGSLAANVTPDDFRGSSARGLTLGAQAPAGTVLTGTEGSMTPSFSVGVSTGEYASIVDYLATTTARGSQDGLPRPSPFSGAMPAGAAGGSASGLGAGSGGLGFGLGALAMLLMLSTLYGRLLLSLRNFLRPTSALVLAIERPG